MEEHKHKYLVVAN